MARLEKFGYQDIQIFSTSEDFLAEIHQQPAIALLDHNLPDDKGLNVLKEVKSTYPSVNCIMLSGQATIGVAVDSLKYGAYDYLLKGKDDNSDKLQDVISECIQFANAVTEKSKKSIFGNFLKL
jgi:FixJ family two-component response regulator